MKDARRFLASIFTFYLNMHLCRRVTRWTVLQQYARRRYRSLMCKIVLRLLASDQVSALFVWVIQQPISCVKRWPRWWGGWCFMVPPLHSHGLGSIPSWPEFRSHCSDGRNVTNWRSVFISLARPLRCRWDKIELLATSCTDVQKKKKNSQRNPIM